VSRWPEVALGEVLRLDLNKVDVDPTVTYPMVGVYSFGRGLFDREPVDGTSTSYRVFYRLDADHIVMSQLFGWEGALAVSSDQFAGKYVSPQFPTFRTDPQRLDPHYLGWFMRRPAFWEELGRRTKGMGDRRRTLNPEALFVSKMPLPPIEEQRRVVRRIEQLAALVDEATRLRESSTATLHALLGARLNALSFHLQITRRLGDVLVEKPRNGWSARCDGVLGGVPVLTLGAVTGFTFDPSAVKLTSLPTQRAAHYWLSPRDLLMTRSNTPELVGHAAIYQGSPHPCIYSDLMMRLRLDESKAHTRFVWYWLQTPLVREHVRRNAKGTSPTMVKIGQQTVMDIPFPDCLSVAAQTRIAGNLDRTAAELDRAVRTHNMTATSLGALLPSALFLQLGGDSKGSVLRAM